MSSVRHGSYDVRTEPACEPAGVRFAGPSLVALALLLTTRVCLASDTPEKTPAKPAPHASKPASHASKPDKVLRAGDVHHSSDPVVVFINQQIRQAWQDNQVLASPAA